jgi:uncharacterized MAPEG superfamily protein
MNTALGLLAAAALVTWVSLLLASLIRASAWTPQGLKLAFGNRDDLPPATPLAGRAQRCAANTLENFVLFAALVLAAQLKGVDAAQVLLGAKLFFWARLAYIPVYYAGIAYLRTGVWLVGVAGMGLILPILL